MDSEGWSQLAVVALGLALVVFAATAETALNSLSRARIRRLVSEGVSRAKGLTKWFEEPGMYLSSVVVIRTAAIILASVLTTVLVLRSFPHSPALTVALLMLFFAVTAICQLAPRALAGREPEQVSLAIAGPMRLLVGILTPLNRLFAAITSAMLRPFGISVSPLSPVVTEEELRMWVNVGEEEGIIEEDEKEMINSIFELEETTVREIMVPRIDMFALEAGASVAEAVEAIIRESYSRIPIYQGNIDNIIGVLYARDLFKPVRDGDWSKPVKEVVRPAYFVPESKKVDELLHELQQKQVHIAIVVDEYGGTAGLVTIEDLLEEIVGEIRDEFDAEEAKVEQLSDNEAIFDATVSIDDVNEILSINLQSDVDSIGGYVYDKLGKIPTAGDRIQVDGVGVEVLKTEGRRIKKVKVTVRRPLIEMPTSD